MTWRRYSEHEEAFLRNHYARKGPKWCALRMGRDPSAVQQKARRMGLVAPRAWTPAEDARLMLMWATGATAAQAARGTGRTARAASARMRELRGRAAPGKEGAMALRDVAEELGGALPVAAELKRLYEENDVLRELARGAVPIVDGREDDAGMRSRWLEQARRAMDGEAS